LPTAFKVVRNARKARFGLGAGIVAEIIE